MSMRGKFTIYKLAREGNIPAHKYGRVWRFDTAELKEWMKSEPYHFAQNTKEIVKEE